MRRLLPLFVLLFSLCGTLPASAQTGTPPSGLQAVPEPPPPPPGYTPDPATDSVTIVKPEDKIEELRQNGKLYMVKVTPLHGKPYYLIDKRGDGVWSRHEGPTAEISVPMWVIGTF